MSTPAISTPWRRLLGAALLCAAPMLAWAQQAGDPPARVAAVGALDGQALIATGAAGNWAPAQLNWPVTTGTRLRTEAGARLELQGGWTVLRLGSRSTLDVTQLDDDTLQVALTEGSLSVRVRNLAPGERVELDTPQLAVVANQPGEYRIDVDPRADTTRVSVHSGTATVYGEAGQSTTVAARQQVLFGGRALAVVQRGGSGRDALDQWAAARDAREEQSRSANYVSREMPGYAQLDQYGEWAQDATYGSVWYPSVGVADWAPYRYGRWSWIEPWGWTWVDDAPWGFAPSHYGRWAQIGPRWAWVPGPLGRRPVYAPALVGFIGGGSGGAQWGISLGSGGPGAAWFPLAPGEYWEPHYHSSDRYRRRLNWGDGRPRGPSRDYHFQRRPDAISVAPDGHFGGDRGRRPHYGDGRLVPHGILEGSRVVAPPPRGQFGGQPPTRRPDGEHGIAQPRPNPNVPVPFGITEGMRPEDRPPPRAAAPTPAPWAGAERDRDRDHNRNRDFDQRERAVREQAPRPNPNVPVPFGVTEGMRPQDRSPAPGAGGFERERAAREFARPPQAQPMPAPPMARQIERQVERPAPPPPPMMQERPRAIPRFGSEEGAPRAMQRNERDREERRAPAQQMRERRNNGENF